MLIYYYGNYTVWQEGWKITFDPENKYIIVNSGETSLDIQIDVYSVWKDWFMLYDNAKYLPAFRTFGGDPTSESQYAPRYFFLINGWKMYAENVRCLLQTNLYSEDGLSPFIVENAAVTIRNSDVPVIKSELEERLDYGDRVYYDETSSYSGTDYPVGTIAQPVNNALDAIAIANLYNIRDFYCLSDVTLPGIVGQSFENYSIYADRENLTATLYGNYLNNIDWHNFTIDGNFSGGTNSFFDCVIENALDTSGQMKGCQINGGIRVWDTMVMSLCYSGIPGSGAPDFDMNENRPTRLSVRSYSGGVDLYNVNQSGDTSTLELIAGQIILNSSCTDGYIDIRGVGYLTNNSSGSTVKTTGFIDSFEQYIDETRETDQRLAYGDRIYYNETSIYTGTTYPIGTIVQPVNNAIDALAIAIPKGINQFYILDDIYLSGITGQHFSNYRLVGQRENITSYVQNIPINTFENMLWSNLIIEGTISGHTNTLDHCILNSLDSFEGVINDSKLIGYLRLAGDVDMINCYSGDDIVTLIREIPHIYLDSPTYGISLDFRNYSGDLHLEKVQNENDYVVIDINSGKITISSGCTDGYIEIRGVGALVNNSGSGCTVNYEGFVNSFQTYIDETRAIDQQLAYGNKLYIDQASGFTGTTYPIGTQYRPVNNIINLFQLSQTLNIKNISVVTDLTIANMPFIADNFNAYSDTPRIPLYVDSISGSRLINVAVYGFDMIDCDFAGNEHFFERCILRHIHNLAGHLVACDLDAGGDINDPFYSSGGTYIEVYGNTTFVNCHPRHAGDPPKIRMINPSGTTCAFRSWNGDLTIDYMVHSDDKLIIEMDAGAVLISSGCTSGQIDIRGVGFVIDNSLSGCTIVRDGQLQASPGEFDGEIVIDTTNGIQGIRYPVGTNSFPVNNLSDALTLLDAYQLKRIRIIGSLTINGGEDLSGIAFDAERSVGNTLIITDAITDFTYFTDLTLLVQQSGSCRYTTSVLVDITDFDGGAKDCLLVGDINIVGTGSNYFTNCDTYTTDVNTPVTIDVGDKKLNIIRCRGFYKITNKTSTNDITVDMVGGKIEIDSTCVDGQIYIAGICEVIDNSASGCTVIRDAQLQSSPFEYENKIVLDTVNGNPGTLFPIGTNSFPVDNLNDALTLLSTYNLSRIHIKGTLTVSNGEDLSNVTFSADRSVGNTLIISSGITDHTYVQDLTAVITQDGTMRYTTSVLVSVAEFDGGAKNCLLVGAINIVGTGSNYLTDCDTYTTDVDNKVPIYINDKKLNIIRCRGYYELVNKTGTDTTTIDLVGGIIEVGSGCTSGTIYISGIADVVDNSGSGCTVINSALSNQEITNSVWDEPIASHTSVGSTGYALYNVSAGASPEVIAAAVWNTALSSITSTGTTGEVLISVTGMTDDMTEISLDVKRILGLTHENFRVLDQVYDTNNLLQSSTIKIYRSASDCDNDVNALATYEMEAVYDVDGRLTNYKTIRTS